MTQMVKAAVLEKLGRIVIREFAMPEIGREDGLLKVEMAGVCGSDPGIYTGKIVSGPLPRILGHEILGRIARVGEIAAKRWGVKEGDRVVVKSSVRCGFCPKCITGDYRYCEQGLGYGTSVSITVPPSLWGAYAEYMYLAPGSIIHKIAESVPAEAGVLVCAVIADGIRWGRYIGDFGIRDSVVIQGPGQQGLALVIAAKESGANPIIVTGRSVDAERLALAREFGADYIIDVDREDVVERVREITGGQMADVVVDVAGSPQALQTSVKLIKAQGTVVSPTTFGTNVTTPLPQDWLATQEIRLQGVFTSDFKAVRRAIKLVESGKYPIEKIVSHRFPLEEAETAVKAVGGLIEGMRPMKAVIVP